jgi:integrase
VPTEERIDKIISAGLQKWITVFSISKHGLRPDEVSKITLRDIDMSRGLLTVRTSMLSKERIIKLKDYALKNIQSYIERRKIVKIDSTIFPNPNAMHGMWHRYGRRSYLNFRDSKLLKIRLCDLRHWTNSK